MAETTARVPEVADDESQVFTLHEESAREELANGRLDEAKTHALQVLAVVPEHEQAHFIIALADYMQLVEEGYWWMYQIVVPRDGVHHTTGIAQEIFKSLPKSEALMLAQARSIVENYDQRLQQIYERLRRVDSLDFAIDLNVAALGRDWNFDGVVSADEQVLFEVERDSHGELVPEGDLRRRPTFRVDHGDILWASAYVSFQRAVLRAILAYDIVNLDMHEIRSWSEPRLVVPLLHADAIRSDVVPLLKRGIMLSRKARKSYLAETDDDREWLPGPHQISQGIPLPMDNAIYDRWERVLDALLLLLDGKSALNINELCIGLNAIVAESNQGADGADDGAQSFYAPSNNNYKIDVGRMLAHPKSLDIDLRPLKADDFTLAALLEMTFEAFLTESIPDSSLLTEMLTTLEDANPTSSKLDEAVSKSTDYLLGAKMRYLLWIN